MELTIKLKYVSLMLESEKMESTNLSCQGILIKIVFLSTIHDKWPNEKRQIFKNLFPHNSLCDIKSKIALLTYVFSSYFKHFTQSWDASISSNIVAPNQAFPQRSGRPKSNLESKHTWQSGKDYHCHTEAHLLRSFPFCSVPVARILANWFRIQFHFPPWRAWHQPSRRD